MSVSSPMEETFFEAVDSGEEDEEEDSVLSLGLSENDSRDIEPLQLMLGQESCTTKLAGAWVSLNDLRRWYRHVSRDSSGQDFLILERILEVGQLFKSQFGEDPDQENWFTDWDEGLLDRWFIFYQSQVSPHLN